MTTFEYGAASSRFSVKAENKLTAYAAMVHHYNRSAYLLVIYSPEECKADSWFSIDGKISARLHELFGGKPDQATDAFDQYVEEHKDAVIAAMNSIKRLI